MEDPENLDERSKEAGLCPISEYEEMLKKAYLRLDSGD